MAENLSGVPIDPAPPPLVVNPPKLPQVPKMPGFKKIGKIPLLIGGVLVLLLLTGGIVLVGSSKNKAPVGVNPSETNQVENLDEATTENVSTKSSELASKKESTKTSSSKTKSSKTKEDKTQKKLRKQVKKIFKGTSTDKDILTYLQLIRDSSDIKQKYDLYIKAFAKMKESYNKNKSDQKLNTMADTVLLVSKFPMYRSSEFSLPK